MAAIIAGGDFGFPCDKDDRIQLVSTFVTSLKRPNPFKNTFPGEDWFELFYNKWKSELSGRKPEIQTLACAVLCNVIVVNADSTVLGDFLDKLGLNPLRTIGHI